MGRLQLQGRCTKSGSEKEILHVWFFEESIEEQSPKLECTDTSAESICGTPACWRIQEHGTLQDCVRLRPVPA